MNVVINLPSLNTQLMWELSTKILRSKIQEKKESTNSI